MLGVVGFCRFVDVSCDTSNPFNPFPIYKDGTTLVKPIVRIRPAEVSRARKHHWLSC